MQIDAEDLGLVRACIRRVEHERHTQRCRQATAAAAPAAPTCAHPAAGDLLPALPLSPPTTAAHGALGWIPAANELEADADATAAQPQVPGAALEERRGAWLWAGWRSWLERRAAAVDAAYRQTTVAERDVILAHRLRRVAQEGEGPVVAVVGANHVPGIVAAWEHALTPEFESRCAAFLRPPAAAAAPAHAWKASAIDGAAWALEGAAVVGLAGGAAAAARRVMPRCPRVAGGAAVAAVGAAVMSAHAWWALQTRPAQLVANLARFNDAAGAPCGL